MPHVASETRYARSGEFNIAYQVVGEGPLDLVYVPGWVSNVDAMWDEPSYARFLSRLASFSRLIVFDKRGTGLSDSVPLEKLPTLEERMDDVRAVMDAVGSPRAAVLGHSEGGNMSMLFSATYPDRTSALVLVGCYAARIRSEDYPWAPDTADRAREFDETERQWADRSMVVSLAPSRATDAAFVTGMTRYFRQAASPKAAAALLRMNTLIDVREILHAIRVPTLLLYRTEDRDVRVEEGRYIAARIPDARLVELPGTDHIMWAGDADAILDEVESFLTGARRGPQPDRVLSTVLFTDLVASTELTASLGDALWRDLLERHDIAIRRELDHWRGREIKTTGDGFLATFDGPARAIRCAVAIRDDLRTLGLEVRAGIHTGEVELLEDDVRGIAVHIGSRIAAIASSGEVLVSGTVADLVHGSGIEFESRGEHDLKGVPGRWRILAVSNV
ncbi:MAG: adenylate/guanylate cyclase domain-containing protein [Tepidiformaceae bacterium]